MITSDTPVSSHAAPVQNAIAAHNPAHTLAIATTICQRIIRRFAPRWSLPSPVFLVTANLSSPGQNSVADAFSAIVIFARWKRSLWKYGFVPPVSSRLVTTPSAQYGRKR